MKARVYSRKSILAVLVSSLFAGHAVAADEAATAPGLPTDTARIVTTPAATQLPVSVDYANIAPIMTAPAMGAPAKMGSIYLYPYLMVGLGRNDNVLGTNTNEISSSLFELRPRIVAEAVNSGDRYTLQYSGDYGHYADSEDDDFDYHDLTLAGDNRFSTRMDLGWRVGYTKRSDPRGSNDTAYGTDPNAWHAPVINALFGYGADGAKGRFEAELGLMNKRYDNNKAATESFNLDTTNLAGRFFYRVAPKTRMLFEVRHTDSDYTLATSTQDNTENLYNVGVTWDTTAATTGIFKLGRLEKDFDAASRKDFSGTSWEGTVRWSPRTYSTFDLTTSRNTADSSGQGDFIINRNLALNWNHKWNDRFGTSVSLGSLKSDYEGVTRSDDTRTFSVGASYDMRRWLRLGANLTRTDRSSDVSTYQYDRNMLMLTVEGTL